MKKTIITSVLYTLITAVILGIGYPLLITGIDHVLFPKQSNGELITRNNEVIGSHLIGQTFTGDTWFNSRPSAAGTGYDAANSSGSGLDPDITPASAYYQVPRIAHARHLSESALTHLIDDTTTQRQFGLLGEPRVNVLDLNLALDALTTH